MKAMSLKIGHKFDENVIFLKMRFRNCVNELLIESVTEIRNKVFKFMYKLHFVFKKKKRLIHVAEWSQLKIFDNGTSFHTELMFGE